MNSPEIHTKTHTHTHIYILTCIYDHVEHGKPVGEEMDYSENHIPKYTLGNQGITWDFKKKIFFF